MAQLRELALALCILFAFLSLGVFALASGQSQTVFQMSPLKLESGEFSPVPYFYSPTITVNVTSTLPITNVTLLYAAATGANFPTNLTSFSRVGMQLVSERGLNSSYQRSLPAYPDGTFVYAVAEASNSNGTAIFSSAQPQQIYNVYTPPQNASLSLDVYVSDINPSLLNMSLYVYGSVYNTINYEDVLLQSQNNQIYDQVNIPEAEAQWASKPQYYTEYYTKGIPALYPFDQYTYSVNLTLNYYPNDQHICLDVIQACPLKPNIVYENFIPARSNSVQSADDLAGFSIASYVVLVPGTNQSVSPKLDITIVASRLPGTSNLEVLFPTIGLYLFLGSSLILKGKNRIANRLTIYLTVFIFSYTFGLGIRGLAGTSAFYGLSVESLVGLALIPCTVALAFATIVGGMFRSRLVHLLCDILGIAVAYAVLYYATPVATQYSGAFTMFSLGEYGWFGWAITLSLFTGITISTLRFALARRASASPKDIDSVY